MPSVVAKLQEIGKYISSPPSPSSSPPQPAARKQHAPNFVQDRFAISFWVDPVVPAAEFPLRYKEIADCNFNVVLGGFGATTLPMIDAQLAASAANGLKVISAGQHVVSNSTSAALWWVPVSF